mmetsp:Transcript_19692/g.22668  ORF Transcript_19692/g.22668 Transcript_19692/m.22668 type:complete len:597 (+) Transcript_19692:248-2038(+)
MKHRIINPSQNTQIKGRCDICTKKDGFRSHNMQKCRTCGVCVHEACYGLIATKTKNRSWQCMACESLSWKPSHKTHGLRQLKRPTKCELCHVNFGIHAMHPLYDKHGPKGRQVRIIEKGEKKMGWVHTLCALYIGSHHMTAGCVYLCDENGNYGDDDDTSEESFNDDDDEDYASSAVSVSKGSTNTKAKSSEGKGKKMTEEDGKGCSKEAEDSDLLAGHNFVIAYESPWDRCIDECRTLKCIYCGINDQKARAIPVQCVCGDDLEIAEFRTRHKESSECYLAMHVGCARWMGNTRGAEPEHQRVYFYPGPPGNVSNEADEEDDPFSSPVSLCYCPAHAADIIINQPKKLKDLLAMKKLSMRETVLKRDISQPRAPRKGELGYEEPVMMNKRTPTSLTLGKHCEEVKQDKRVAIGSAAGSSVGKRADESAQVNATKDWSSVVKNDLLKVINEVITDGGSTKDATNERKKFWKKETQLSKEDFKNLWNTVKEVVKKAFQSTDNDGGAQLKDSKPSLTESPKSTDLVQIRNEKMIAKQPQAVEAKALTADMENRINDKSKVLKKIDVLNDPSNRWSDLWMPHYVADNIYTFGEWDSSPV